MIDSSPSIESLRAALPTPVNVVLDHERDALEVPSGPSEPEAAVADAARRNGLRWRKIGSRFVLYPDDDVWERPVSGVHLAGVGRAAAADAYTAEVRRHVPELGGFVGGVVRGDPDAAIYTEPVSLSPDATILKHLVELLGDDPDLVFTVEPASEGRLVLHFEHVPRAGDRT